MHTQATIYIRILNLRNVKNHYKYYKIFPTAMQDSAEACI